jgi:hypothetical protein
MRGDSEGRSRIRLRNIPIPASQTDEGKARLNDYWLALGEFVDSFARAEHDIHLVLRWHTKTLDKVARAVFSGVRIDAACSFLRRLADIEFIDSTEWAELEPVLTQLKTINDARNLILHHGAEQVAEGKGVATNRKIALTEEAAKTIPLSPGIIRSMSSDIHKIRIHLRIRHMGRPLRGSHPQIDELLHGAWRYQPPAPPKTTKADKGRSPTKERRQSAPRQSKPSPK